MKKLFFIILLLAVFINPSVAGEIVTLPSALILTAATTDQAEKINIDIQYLPGGNAHAVLTYKILDNNGRVYDTHSVKVQNLPDDPTTDPTLCTDIDIPYGCCTGAYPGDSNTGCDESTTDFTDLVQGFAATLNTRAATIMWQDAQTHYEVQP